MSHERLKTLSKLYISLPKFNQRPTTFIILSPMFGITFSSVEEVEGATMEQKIFSDLSSGRSRPHWKAESFVSRLISCVSDVIITVTVAHSLHMGTFVFLKSRLCLGQRRRCFNSNIWHRQRKHCNHMVLYNVPAQFLSLWMTLYDPDSNSMAAVVRISTKADASLQSWPIKCCRQMKKTTWSLFAFGELYWHLSSNCDGIF